MKNLSLIVAIIGLVSQWGKSQVTCPGANFTTQTEVNQYVSNYPGCEVVTGSLDFYYDGSDPITDVSGLTSISKVYGNLNIESGSNLNFSLNSLDSIFGSFYFHVFQDLPSISMDNLKYVENYFDINQESSGSLSVTFPNLTYVYLLGVGNIAEANFPDLENCEHLGINNVRSVNGFNNITNINGFDLFADSVSGFNSLQSVNSTFNLLVNNSINGFNSLQNVSSILLRTSHINGFNALQSGELTFQNNQIIEGFNSYNQSLNLNFNGQKINGFNAVPSGTYSIVADTIIGFNGLTNSPNLTLHAPHISGFDALENATQLNIITQNLSGFNALTQANNINITADAIAGFGALPYVANLNLTGYLNSFNAFTILDSISQSLTLQTQRSDYNIFPALQNVESVSISNSPNFTGSAFFPLAKFKNLDISNCSSLVNLSGLLHRSKYGSVNLLNNTAMTNLTGLESVKNVVDLTINGNTSLTDIEALDSLRIIQGNLSLVNNTSLNECCVLAFYHQSQ